MEKAIWLSYIFGPYLVIISLFWLFYRDNANKICMSIKNSPGAFYLLSIFHLLVGLTIIDTFNMWPANLAILVSLLGWVMALRGVFGLFIPHLVISEMTHKTWATLKGVITLVWGILLCIFAAMGPY